ncbi:CDPK-related protein kinase [Hordeum vulgare]|nr:CDPK-related protein kinase [Hordeum vulgare]
MWSFGRGSDSTSAAATTPSVERRTRSEARGSACEDVDQPRLSSLPSFLVRETKGYGRRHGRTLSSAAGSSSAARASSYAGSSSSSDARLLPVKRQWSEEPQDVEFVPVKEEPEELGRRGVVGPEDFVADVDAVAAAIAERSVREEAERRGHEEEIEDLQWRQAVTTNLAAKARTTSGGASARTKGEVHRCLQLRRGGFSSSEASSMAASSPP